MPFELVVQQREVMELPQSRLDSLYKDFRHLEELNPDGYKANIETWKAFLIKNYLIQAKSIYLRCGSGLLRTLSRESHGVPKSLDLVINSLIESDYLITPDDFYNGLMYPQESSWFLKWIGFSGRNKRSFDVRKNNDTFYLKETDLIIRNIVEEKFESIKQRITNNIVSHATGITDLVFTKQEFYAKSGINELLIDSEPERKAMLFYLSHYRKIIVGDADIIKVVSPDVVHILADFPKIVTQDDHRVASLKATTINVNLQVKKLQAQVFDYSSMLQDAIKDSQPKEIQRNYLQNKKMIEKNLSRLLIYQNNLLTVKSQLDMAATNQLLVSTLEGSNKLLTSINEYTGSVEKVEDLLDEIKEQGERTEAINEILAGSESTKEDMELDRELEKIQEEENQKKAVSDDKKENVKSQESNDELIEKLGNLKLEERRAPGELREKNMNSVPNQEGNAIAY